MAAHTEHDYVAVGGGQAGLVVAARLSEDPSRSVLVIEAGGHKKGDLKVDTPGLRAAQWDNPEYDWAFMTEPQTHANSRRLACPRGRLLGGSSAMNLSAIVYPSRADFDGWAHELGNPGWAAADVFPYLRKFQAYEPAPAALKERLLMDRWADESPSIQGYGGPVPAIFGDEQLGPFNEAWMRTFDRLGYLAGRDPAAGEGGTLGAFQSPLSVYKKTGTRAYSASAYYSDDIAARPNLHVLTDALATRIAFDGDKAPVTATGVRFVDKAGVEGYARARKEVIVCCGAIKSPQLLELSGIGDRALLARHGIQVVVDNPHVGENLQDHALASISYEVADGLVSGDVMRDPAVVAAMMARYAETHTGPLAGAPFSFAFVPVVDSDGALTRDRIEALIAESNALRDGDVNPQTKAKVPSLERQHALVRARLLDQGYAVGELMFMPVQLNGNTQHGSATTMQDFAAKRAAGNFITIITMLNNPFSRGSVHLVSPDPAVAPAVDPQLLAHPLDLEILARQLQFAERVASTEPMASMLKASGQRIPAGADASDLESARGIVRDRLFTMFHPSGTCAMMPRDLGGVVDSRLVVHGMTNVRVVDASVFPMEPRGNVQSTVYAVAEKAADLIKQDA